MKLLGSLRSPYCRKVMVVAHELGLADQVELVSAAVASTVGNPDVLALNPLGKVPVLVTPEGTSVYDSLVICMYLGSLASTGTTPALAPTESFQVMKWHALGQGTTDVLLQWNRERTRPESKRTPGYAPLLAAKVTSAIAEMDRLSELLTGAPFGLGHAAIASALGYLDFRFEDTDWRAGNDRLAAWFADVSRRPSIQLTRPQAAVAS
jgi:glutathione S-transferase